MRSPRFTRFKKYIAAAFLIVVIVAQTVVPHPVSAQAGGGVPVIDIANLTNEGRQEVMAKIGEVLKNTLLLGIRNALSAFLGKLAYDSAVWIASAGTGQQGLIFDKPPGEYLAEAGAAAAGGLIDGFAEASGLDAAGLCDPGDNFRISLGIGLDTSVTSPYKPSCTFAELADNWQEAYSDPKFNDYLELSFDPAANPMGISLEAAGMTIVAQGEGEKAAEIEQLKSSFKDVTEAVSKTIITPGDYIRDREIAQQLTFGEAVLQQTGNVVSDTASVFTSTLIAKLLERAQQGLANLSSGSDLSSLLSGEASGVSSGRAAAEEIFADLKQPTFVSSGVFDILAELSSCPSEDDVKGINNCVIGQTMQLAISEGWTVQEFVDYQSEIGGSYAFADSSLEDGLVAADNGVTPRGIILLKKNRIIPVGWQIASDYIQQSSTTVTLDQLVSCYNACGSEDDVGSCPSTMLTTDADGNSTSYSPYCGLVDPFWVLKAPQNFCEREAPGPNFGSLESLDNDQNVSTQEVLFGSRLNYCADSRGCIEEEQEGVCTAYGYCTKEDRIYRFDGEVCSEEYSSCQSFEDEAGNDVSYVKSSLNYNGCATDPGCQWYCLSTNGVGQFDCASPTSTYVSCSDDVATNEGDYGLSYDVTYNANEICACTAEQTCQVDAGSDAGDNNGDGLLDYRECEVTNNNGTPAVTSDDTTSVCTLSDNCGASNSTYDSSTGTCTCTISNTCAVAFGADSCDSTVEESDGSNGIHTCSLAEENGSNTCSADYSTYSTTPYCEVATTGLLNCGDTCFTTVGGTCTNNLGNSCTDGDTTDDADGTADGDCTLVDLCSIASGSYSCLSENGNTCILGTVTEDPQAENATIYFDNNVSECSANDAGCNQYIRIKPDTNLIPNALFEYYDTDRNTIDDSNGDSVLVPGIDDDDLAFCTHNGRGCASDAECIEDLNSDGDGLDANEAEGQCIGWIQNGVTAYLLSSTFDGGLTTPDLDDDLYVQIPADSTNGTLEMAVDTGHDLENRTFTFAYRAMTLGSACETNDVTFTIGTADGSEVSDPITADSDGIDYGYTSTWTDFTVTYTFPDESDASAYGGSGDSGTEIKVAIKESTSCDIAIEAAALYEADEWSGDYTNYAENNTVSLNSDTVSCEPEDVGCELYVEDGKAESDGVPGTITNPESDACLDAAGDYDYSDPSCNQCNGNPANDEADDYYVGCGFYQEVPLDSAAPLTTDPLPSWLTAGTDSYNGAIQRLGGYCEVDSSQHCYVNSDCVSGACIDYLSIVPDSATQCSAAAVGCEEYTNLAAVEAGGEGLEYYTQLQQCVRTDDQSTGVFYTFEGSDTAGVQIVDHTLKVDQASASGAPCTHLDQQSEDYNADCIDSTEYTSNEQLAWDCGPAGDIDSDGILNDSDADTNDYEYGTEADCRQYIDDSGTIFYRYESDVIVASDDCTPLRNSLDTRVYFALTGDSLVCSEAVVGCREYKGTNSGSEETIIDEGFAENTTDNWANAESTSNESVLTSGYSLQLHDSDTADTSNEEIQYALFTSDDIDGDGTDDIVGLLEAGTSYLLTFWAKTTAGGNLTAALDFGGNAYYFTTDGYETSSANVTLDPSGSGDWQQYVLGPVIVSNTEAVDEGDEYFTLEFTGATTASEAYIDTINLTQSNSHYLIQDTANTCNGFEGCREYEDRSGTTHYLKSFSRLCADSVVGCEAMIATQNSSHPFTEAFNQDNEYDEDDVIVQYDQSTTLVYDADNECSAEVNGCIEVGLPAVDERTGAVTDFETTYLLSTPDSYDSILCEQPQLSCSEYTSSYDGTVYFKDPGEKICELKEYTAGGNTYNGWFKLESEASEPDCPLQNDFSDYSNYYASQPLGGVCNSNSIKVGDGACTAASGEVVSTVINQTDCEAYDSDSDGTGDGVWDERYVDSLVGALCNQDADCYPAGWESNDPRPRCISDLADDVDVNDGNVHQYEDTLDDGVTLTDVVSDFGWVGTCPGDQSGCSEYVDPYSPNIDEINRNYSFEDDVRGDDNVYYASDASATGFPDYWTIPTNTTGYDSNGDGVIDAYYDIDINADGITDFYAATCTTPNALMTNSSAYETAYSGTTVNPAEGDAALALSGQCAVENIGSDYEVQPDKTYNIQAQIKMSQSLLDTGSNTPASFSIGVHYYFNDGSDADDLAELVQVDDTALYPVAQEATIDYEDGADSDGLSYWYRFQGNIGLGTTAPIPIVLACSDPYYTTAISCRNSGSCSSSASRYSTEVACESAGAIWTANTWGYRPVDSARAFIVNNSNSSDTIYIDAFSFKEADKYYYLDYTVDGTSEREQLDGSNSCTDQDTDEATITSDGGCVAFRDVTADTQNYSQDGLDCTTCLLTPNSDSCRYIVDACDTNTVLKVKKDRVCSEWLACETASLVEDSSGNVSSQCFSINQCNRLDEDGSCAGWIANPGYDKLTDSIDEHVSSSENDTFTLQEIRNRTGYSKVGVTWGDILTCNGGPKAGFSCTADEDCVNSSITCEDTDGDGDTECSNNTLTSCSDVAECYGENDYGTCSIPFSTEGYYPYGWMTEVGQYGAQTGEDLIELRDFESLYCSGGRGDYVTPCVKNGTTDDPGHCYTNDLKQEVESAAEGDLAISDVVYIDDAATGETFDDTSSNNDLAFCPNNPNFGDYWPFGGNGLKYSAYGWTPMGEDDDDSTNMSDDSGASYIHITQYENEKPGFTNDNCVAPCEDIDLNNVLEVAPALDTDADTGDNTAFSGGVEYDLYDNIVQDGSYALSFDGRYSGNYVAATDGAVPSTITICLSHATIYNSDGNVKDTKDCFVNGFGQVDIVFIVDTSSSMDDNGYTDSRGAPHPRGGPIATILVAIPDLSASLASNGIDAQFAIVDMEEIPVLEMDLTSDLATLDAVFSSSCRDQFDNQCLEADTASVDPWWAIANVINNRDFDIFGSPQYNSNYSNGLLEFRSEAQPIIVLVTDTIDELGSSANAYDESYVSALLDETNIPIVVVTDDGSESYYTNIAQQSGGDTTDGIADTDWRAGSDSVNNSILNIILGTVDIFQFSNTMEHYSLGPITVEDKSPNTADDEYALETVTTQLQFMGSDESVFQIDNVSLLPVLEVNKDLEPIGRSCRAYPEADSLQCVYTETNGTQFRGWKGYCLETDPAHANTCLVWWPLDVLEGEESIVSREPAGYDGRASVYSCLVSRGLARPAFCDEDEYENSDDRYETGWGEGVMCGSADGADHEAVCSQQDGPLDCFYGANYTIADSSPGGVIEHDDLSDTYNEETTVDGGSCLILDESNVDCAAWAWGGTCSDSAYDNEGDCEANGKTWNETIDLLNDLQILDTGTCIDVDGDYSEDYSDEQADSTSTDKFCFYDVDGRGNAEVRSTRSCSSNSTCQISTSTSYECAQLACQTGATNEACSVGGSECSQTFGAHIENPYEVRPLRWQMHDPWDSTYTYQSGLITRLPANEIMHNIHISEIETLEFNPGSAGRGSASGDEFPYWGQLNINGEPSIYDNGESDSLSEIGNVWLSDLKQGAIEFEDDGSTKYKSFNCRTYRESGTDNAGFGCRYWGLWDSDMVWNNYTAENLPNLTTDDADGTGGYDLVYTWVWGQYDWAASDSNIECNMGTDEDKPYARYGTLSQSDNYDKWFESDCVDGSLRAVAGTDTDAGARNPWAHLEDQDIWNSIYVPNIEDETSKTVAINPDNVDNWAGWADPFDQFECCDIGSQGGGNLMSLFVDFNEEGYIQAVYVLLWGAAKGTTDIKIGGGVYFETTYENMMHLDLQTRESCALISEDVDSTGGNYAWADRFSEGSEYQVNFGGDYPIESSSNHPPYGSIAPMVDTPDTDAADSITDTDWTSSTDDYPIDLFGTLGKQPLFSMQTDDYTSQTPAGHPASCIGDCSQAACVGDPEFVGTECDDDSDCGEGVCMGIGDSDISNDADRSSGYSNFSAQLTEDASIDAQERLKFILAGIKSDTYYRIDFADDTLYRKNVPAYDYWSTNPADPTLNIFDHMPQCNTADGSRPVDSEGDDSEYCGVFPSVDAISINGETSSSTGFYSIGNGQTVTLEFTAEVDGEQQPLNNIYIDWGDGTTPVNESWNAKPTTHTYTHAYNCSQDNGARYKSNHCEFTPKIVLVDNWNWCSGLISGTCITNDAYETREECEDHSEFWSNLGDHRYDPEDGSNNLIDQCQSYDEPGITLYVDAAS